MKPPIVRAHGIITQIRNTLAFEASQFDMLWTDVYGMDDMADAQAVMDAIPAAGDVGQPSTTAAAIFAVSALQVLTHNLSAGLLTNPALLADTDVQAALAALATLRGKENIPAVVADNVPYHSTLNPDGTVTYAPAEII